MIRSSVRSWSGRLVPGIALSATVLAVCGIAVRVSLKDRVPYLSAVFYGLPLVLVAALLLMAAAGWFASGRRRAAAASLLGALICGAVWLSTTWQTHPCEPHPGAIRVALWNVAHGQMGWDRIGAAVTAFDADILVLAEANGPRDDVAGFWRARLPGYSIYRARGGLLLLTRGRILRESQQSLGHDNHAAEAEIEIDGRRLRVVLVDLNADPLESRRVRLERVTQFATQGTLPTLVMGDFNTPIDSLWMKPLRARFRHAFEVAGNGLLVTWPSFAPLIAIDHVWLSPEWQVHCARIGPTWLSDHRPVVAEVWLQVH